MSKLNKTQRLNARRAAKAATTLAQAEALNATPPATSTSLVALAPPPAPEPDALDGEILEPGAPDPTTKPNKPRKGNVIPLRYRAEYKACALANPGCGDNIARELEGEFCDIGPDGKARLDVVRFQRWAAQHGFWQDKYWGLNPGMQRMNVGNRCRAAVRKGAEVRTPNGTLLQA